MRYRVVLIFPRSRGVDRFAVHVQPLPELFQTFFEYRSDHAIGSRPDVEQKIASTTATHRTLCLIQRRSPAPIMEI